MIAPHDKRRDLGGTSHSPAARYLGEHISHAWCDGSFAQWPELRAAALRDEPGARRMFGTADAFVLDVKAAQPDAAFIDLWPIVMDGLRLPEHPLLRSEVRRML